MRGDAGQLLDQLRADLARVVRRAAAEDLHPLEVARLTRRQVQAAEVRGGEALVEAAGEGAQDGRGLLVDLLAQEVLVPGRVVVRGGGLRGRGLLGDGARVEREGGEPARAHDGQFAVVEVHDLARVADHGRDVGRGEHLLLADAEDDRAAVARHDDHAGQLAVHNRDAVRADDLVQRAAHRVLEAQARGRLRGDQVHEDFGVGLGGEGHAVRLELGAQVVGVLDDAVVHDREPPGLAHVRVRVGVARLAVGGPAGVADSGRAAEAGRDGRGELGDPPLLLADPEIRLADDRQAGRVIAAVLEPGQPVQQDRGRVLRADVGDDAAHVIPRFRSSVGSSVDEAAQLTDRQLGCGHRPVPQLGRDPLEDRIVRQPARLQLAVPPPHEVLDALVEVRLHVRDHARRATRREPGGAHDVLEKIVVGRGGGRHTQDVSPGPWPKPRFLPGIGQEFLPLALRIVS